MPRVPVTEPDEIRGFMSWCQFKLSNVWKRVFRDTLLVCSLLVNLSSSSWKEDAVLNLGSRTYSVLRLRHSRSSRRSKTRLNQQMASVLTYIS